MAAIRSTSGSSLQSLWPTATLECQDGHRLFSFTSTLAHKRSVKESTMQASAMCLSTFIFADLCPYTQSGKLPGSRTEYMHWLQEARDEKAIVRQYCRDTGEVRTGLNVKQTVGRALQFASSTPKGPAYIASAREVLAQEIQLYSLEKDQWVPIGPSALPY
ncbi:hypothetical protein VPNG_05782 [Cytospora leucostoma]|uniref:Uncharacterized protein n=1 Tax=Cytospora leucostoma TaxID=1230097 RepID=A0A423X094_9PEZI|nr:hypothetical protein VPNG_05782 [Cytospora leucostoma]